VCSFSVLNERAEGQWKDLEQQDWIKELVRPCETLRFIRKHGNKFVVGSFILYLFVCVHSRVYTNNNNNSNIYK
jgi:mannosyltransferase OCH1-like enzyme